MNKLPVFPIALKMLIVPVWMTVTFGVIVGSFAFVFSSNARAENNILGVRDEQTYQFYTAVPQNRSQLVQQIEVADTRYLKLKEFFRIYNAPLTMVDAASDFIAAADYYQLPWTLLPAISCKESGCGRIIPTGSFNPFGWAVYTGQTSGANFSSFNEAVWVVAKGLRADYYDQGLDTIAEIETKYTPPSAATHQHWQIDVSFFMDQLETWSL
ncbi:hypothetical protein KC614_04075 [candidate division WWE3 bacterium]|uniref:Mannosyl-glycoprotein endo-beta-N-acetylglucosamidase-like domain-containing protein n=1 Tax=candidate division WWE3 bacterium TaxID=2053526 RepID=A0A955RS93_UNCKA|nr:hypothetical protein [candidate division WWE3 bacterium]